MENDFPLSIEEQYEIEATLQEEWNPPKNIVFLFDHNKELLKMGRYQWKYNLHIEQFHSAHIHGHQSNQVV